MQVPEVYFSAILMLTYRGNRLTPSTSELNSPLVQVETVQTRCNFLRDYCNHTDNTSKSLQNNMNARGKGCGTCRGLVPAEWNTRTFGVYLQTNNQFQIVASPAIEVSQSVHAVRNRIDHVRATEYASLGLIQRTVSALCLGDHFQWEQILGRFLKFRSLEHPLSIWNYTTT